MLSLRCSLSLLFLFFFSRVSRGRKECKSACFNEDIRYMSFPPTPNKILSRRTTKAQQKTVSSHRKRVSLSVLFSFAFASLFPFSFVLFAKGVRCRDCKRRSRRKARAICSQTVSDQKFIHRTRDHPYFRGTNRVASNASFANVSSATGAALLIRVVSSSSFSSRVKSAVNGVNIVIKRRENKSFSEKPLREKNEHILLH